MEPPGALPGPGRRALERNRAGILLGVLGLGLECFWRLRQNTCAVNVFEWDGADFTLVALNDTCHLR